MRIAISATAGSLDAEVDPHFGRARFFIIVDGTTGAVDVIDNAAATELPHGAGIAAVETMVRRGVATVVTGEVGPKAEQGLQAAGIEVRRGATGHCRDALEAAAPELAPVVAAAPVA
jgi:predicted Fe-Mo cluster-binding NifX family protein